MKLFSDITIDAPQVYKCTMSFNAKFREIGPFSLKIDTKTLGTTFEFIKNASESFLEIWPFDLATFWPLTFAA